VELPDWLPADVLQEMVLRYRQHLSDALLCFSRLKGLPGVRSHHGRCHSYSGATTSESTGLSELDDEKFLRIAAVLF
jgi:hypothetical protein